MHIAVFGATGGTGRAFVEQALDAGHTITALARTPSKLNIDHPGLTVIQGDALVAADVAQTVAGADGVLASLGSGLNDETKVVSRGTEQIIAAMVAEGVRRLVVIGAMGTGDSADQVGFAFKMIMKTVLKKTMAEKEAQEKIVAASGLDWVMVRPSGLTDGPRTGNYTFGVDKSLKAGQISRADVADFALKQFSEDTFVGKTPAVT